MCPLWRVSKLLKITAQNCSSRFQVRPSWRKTSLWKIQRMEHMEGRLAQYSTEGGKSALLTGVYTRKWVEERWQDPPECTLPRWVRTNLRGAQGHQRSRDTQVFGLFAPRYWGALQTLWEEKVNVDSHLHSWAWFCSLSWFNQKGHLILVQNNLHFDLPAKSMKSFVTSSMISYREKMCNFWK